MQSIIKRILLCLGILTIFFIANRVQISSAESNDPGNVYFPLLLNRYPPPVPQPGYWHGIGGVGDDYDEVEFFVTVDSAHVFEFMLNFAEDLTEPGCTFAGIGFAAFVPITNGSFLWDQSASPSGSLITGTFASEHTAYGELEVFCSEHYGPWKWEAVWVNDNQG